ncbi:MAG: YqgE/AlgH family protein [Chitinophagaceae bacterium]
MNTPGPGTLLIAEPFMKDPNFMRSVVLICEHQDEGSFGFVLNRLFENTLNELMNDMDELTLPVYYGGPVQVDTIHFLHQYPDLIPGSYEILDGIFWGGDFQVAIELLREEKIDKSKIRFFLGYSGWGNGQLDIELKEKSWLTATATRKLVFPRDVAELWKDALKHLGGDYVMMTNFPIDPQLN